MSRTNKPMTVHCCVYFKAWLVNEFLAFSLRKCEVSRRTSVVSEWASTVTTSFSVMTG